MTADRPARWHKLLILPPIVLGVLVLLWMSEGRQPPVQVERGEPERTVRVIEAPLLELIPKAEGYGPVRPARVWTAVAQVAGRVVEIHPKLRDGEILPEGALLLRIDPIDYALALGQARAGLAELDIQERNAQTSLAIESVRLCYQHCLGTGKISHIRGFRLARQRSFADFPALVGIVTDSFTAARNNGVHVSVPLRCKGFSCYATRVNRNISPQASHLRSALLLGP